MADPKPDRVSEYQRNQSLMEQRPVKRQSNAHSPFSDEATVIIPLSRERRKALRQSRDVYRYTKGKKSRAHKISLRKYNKMAREQDATPKSERFGT